MSNSNMPASKTVSFITMGCAKNEVDSAHMAQKLVNSGYIVVDDPECADAVIVNTCSFIQAATEESIDAILEAAGYENISAGNSHLVVAGCMPSRYGDDLAHELPEVASFVPCSREDDIVSVLDGLFDIERIGYTGTAIGKAWYGDTPVSAYVKLSDGCDRFCTYCAIPYIRGRYHSYSFDTIFDEVKLLVTSGTREIVLIAQDTGRWGTDLQPSSTLSQLLESLAKSFPNTWFRVMYIQPEGVTDDLIETIATHENICNYFDIPLQHVDAELLKRMNRTGNRLDFEKLASRIRNRIPDATLRTTLIAGFPGESDEQFDELCDFVETGLFDYVGVFAYSREEGTRAYDLDGQIDEDEKAYRAQVLRDLADSVCVPKVSERIGKSFNVLVCGYEEDGQLFGRAACQAPDVDGVTYLDSGDIGCFVTATIEETLLYEMEGTVCK